MWRVKDSTEERESKRLKEEMGGNEPKEKPTAHSTLFWVGFAGQMGGMDNANGVFILSAPLWLV